MLFVFYLVGCVLLANNLECKPVVEFYTNVGQLFEFRCLTNETSTFNRIKHTLENGTEEILLSNEHVNPLFERNEVQVSKKDHIYILRILPVQIHSAGLYECEDDMTSSQVNEHTASVRLRVNAPMMRMGVMSGADKGSMVSFTCQALSLVAPLLLSKAIF